MIDNRIVRRRLAIPVKKPEEGWVIQTLLIVTVVFVYQALILAGHLVWLLEARVARMLVGLIHG